MTQPHLSNLFCPKCFSRSNFCVDVLATVKITDTGPRLVDGYYADGDFTCICLSCDYEGRVFEFTKAAEVRS